MSPATRLALTVTCALLGAAVTVGVGAFAPPLAPVTGATLALILLGAAALIRWRKP